MLLLDTNILIDYLRLYPPAINFLDQLDKDERNISILTSFELLQGCQSPEQHKRIDKFLEHFTIHSLNEKVTTLAWDTYRTHTVRIHIDIIDSFIAAATLSHNFTLITRNQKHYQNIKGLKVKAPY